MINYFQNYIDNPLIAINRMQQYAQNDITQ